MAHEGIHKTTMKTPVGANAFMRTPFDLSTSAQVFQRRIDTAIRKLDFVYGYVDDLLFFSKSENENLKHLTILFDRINKFV